MRVTTPWRQNTSGYVRALPTLSRAAELIDISPAGITRGVEELGLEPIPWRPPREAPQIGELAVLLAEYRRRAEDLGVCPMSRAAIDRACG